MDFDDAQAALFLLRTSYGIVRANHFMRTTPLDHWQSQAQDFDEMVCSTAEGMGFILPADSYIQALVLRWVGLGFVAS